MHVVATEHGAQQFGGALARDQRIGFGAEGERGQVAGLDLGGVVHTGGHAVGDEVDEEGFLAGGRGLQEVDDVSGLLRAQRQRRDPEGGAFGGVVAVGLQHGGSPGNANRFWKILEVECQAFGAISFRPLK